MKYIIELEDEPRKNTDGSDYYICNRLTPYEEPKYTAEDVWELVRIILSPPTDGGMSSREIEECFEAEYIKDILRMSFDEAMNKYTTWQKSKDKIRVGDEVRHKDGSEDIMVYTGTDDSRYVSGIRPDGRVAIRRVDEIVKTGRHFEQVEELLEKMRGDK